MVNKKSAIVASLLSLSLLVGCGNKQPSDEDMEAYIKEAYSSISASEALEKGDNSIPSSSSERNGAQSSEELKEIDLFEGVKVVMLSEYRFVPSRFKIDTSECTGFISDCINVYHTLDYHFVTEDGERTDRVDCTNGDTVTIEVKMQDGMLEKYGYTTENLRKELLIDGYLGYLSFDNYVNADFTEINAFADRCISADLLGTDENPEQSVEGKRHTLFEGPNLSTFTTITTFTTIKSIDKIEPICRIIHYSGSYKVIYKVFYTTDADEKEVTFGVVIFGRLLINNKNELFVTDDGYGFGLLTSTSELKNAIITYENGYIKPYVNECEIYVSIDGIGHGRIIREGKVCTAEEYVEKEARSEAGKDSIIIKQSS